jgi:hypothetical protein
MTRLARALATLAMTVTLCAGVAPTPARAQEPAAAEGEAGEGSGRPWDGYIATAALAFLALFIVAKSARR